MLVVTRKAKQSLIIGESIEVVILESRDGVTKIGINAPKDIKVYRKEVFDEIKDQNIKALNTSAGMLAGLIDGNDK